jgi:two-component system phosphate regulon sensor histidine kinase PhoR
VQFFLVYNTYKLKDEHFFSVEKSVINDSYSKSIRNDKVYPGGQKIIDHFVNNDMEMLETLYKNDTAQFAIAKQKMCDSIFSELRRRSNMDSLFQAIVINDKLKQNLKYLLTIEALSITFSNNHYISLYQKGTDYPLLNAAIRVPAGVRIDGSLETPSRQNLVTFLNVSSPADHSYQITFSLYVDASNRYLSIFFLMMPTFVLCLFSILAVVLIYFFTFKNWLEQKKLAEMKSDFANSITHEFHTPLATIMIANKNLQNSKVLERRENIQPLTSIIDRQSQRLQKLFSRVLDVTVMNEATLQKKEYRVNDLLDEVLLDYRLQLPDKNIEIDFFKSSENPEISLDRFWFTTMLFNIFENAIKYNDSDVKAIAVRTLIKKKNIEIHIADNGIGMSPTTVNLIFEKFYRDHTVNKFDNPANGLGLGLFYTRQCIKAHGWQIEVLSTEKKGSEFIIFMPVENF